ncbi:hypothetical protein VTO73DRAFT_11901 [Trametes versicolor]
MGTDLDLTAGALLLGVLITDIGYGITTTQTYMYMTRFTRDPWFIRGTVWTLLAIDTAHIAFTWHMVYHYLIRNFSNVSALEDAVWSFSATIVLTAIITVIAHCFYARRILILGGRKWLLPALLILILSVMRLVFGFIAVVQIDNLKSFQLIKHGTLVTVVIGLSSGTLADCVITGSLVYLLRIHKSELSPRCALILLNSILDRITYWVVNNGLLTCVVGIAFLITQFAPMPANMVFIALHMLLSKLYANSLLATLNSRDSHVAGRGVDTVELNSAIIFSTVIQNAPSRNTPSSGGAAATMFGVGKDAEAGATSQEAMPILHIAAPVATRVNTRYDAGNEAVWRPIIRTQADGVSAVRQLGYNWG